MLTKQRMSGLRAKALMISTHLVSVFDLAVRS